MRGETTKGLTITYVTVLLALAALATVSFLVLQMLTRGQEDYAALINTSGRQRLLTKEIAYLSTRLVLTNGEERQDIRQRAKAATQELEKMHDSLVRGRFARHMTEPVHAIVFADPWNLDSELRAYVAHARVLRQQAAAALTADNPHLVYLQDQASDSLIKTLNRLVAQYQKDAEANVSRHQSVEIALLTTTLALLLATGAFVFRPMVLRIRQQTEDLLASRARLQAVIDNAADGVVVVDSQGRIKSANPAAQRMFGYAADEVSEKDLSALLRKDGNGRHRDRRMETAGRGRQGVADWRGEAVGIRRDGSTFSMEVVISEIRGLQGQGRWVGLMRDITERKRAERDRDAALAKLAQSNRDLEQFAYVASHDLQEPLRMVSSYVKLIEHRYHDRLDDEGREFIEFAAGGAKRMQGLIQSLLQYSRVGRKETPLQTVDCNAVVNDVSQDLKHVIADNEARVACDALPGVRGDGAQLQQLFQNLVENAIRYRGKSPPDIHISARWIEDSDDGDGSSAEAGHWLFAVRDNGIGFKPEYAERIFDVFQRLHTQEQYSGTGIGLAICKRIVEFHGGRIWAESEPGSGSTFYFVIPGASMQDDRPARHQAGEAEGGEEDHGDDYDTNERRRQND